MVRIVSGVLLWQTEGKVNKCVRLPELSSNNCLLENRSINASEIAMSLRRYTKGVDGTIPVQALLYEDEELLVSQDNIGIYDG